MAECPRDTYQIPKKWIEIAAEEFYGCNELLSVVIHDKVVSIGERAFGGCTSLSSISLGAGLESIGQSAFYHCEALEIINIPATVTHIGVGAFVGCHSLRKIYVQPKNDKFIDRGGVLFEMESGVKLIHDPTARDIYQSPLYVTSIGDSAFEESGIEILELTDSVKEIGEMAFAMSYLTNITIPRSVNRIGTYAFYCCYYLESVTFMNSPETISDGLFSCCVSLLSVIVPNSVKKLGMCSFEECYQLSSVSFGASLESIGSRAFQGCSALTSIEIPASLSSIGSAAFNRCDSLESINIDPENIHFVMIENVIFSADHQTLVRFIDNARENIHYEIPDTVVSIGDDAFSEMNLTSVVIPNSVTSIGRYAFYSTNLTEVTIPSGIESLGEYVFSETGISSIVIPEPITIIPAFAFNSCGSLSLVKLPSKLTNISKYAFYECSGLTEIDLPESLTYIGMSAFRGCASLQSISFPPLVAYIVDHAFMNCFSLQSVTFLNSPEVISDLTFCQCYSLVLVSLPDSVKSIGVYSFFSCDALTVFKISKSLTYISDLALSYCTNLARIEVDPENKHFVDIDGVLFSRDYSVLVLFPPAKSGRYDIPDGVASIGTGAFVGCTLLTHVHVPDSVSSMGDMCFAECGSLVSVNIPNSVPVIGEMSFGACAELPSIVIPNSVTVIEAQAFIYCLALESLVIPNSVTTIGSSAFQECELLVSLTIAASVSNIGSKAFYYCAALSKVCFEGTTQPNGDKTVFAGCKEDLVVDVPFLYKSSTFLGLDIAKQDDTVDEVNVELIVVILSVIVLVFAEVSTAFIKHKPAKKTDTDEYDESIWQTMLLHMWAVMVLISVFVQSYIGFSVFLYCTLLILFTPLTTGLSYIAFVEDAVLEFAQLVSWFFYAIPFMAFLISINYQLFIRFFRNYRGTFDLTRVVDYIRHQVYKPSGIRKGLAVIGLALFSLIGVAFIVIFCFVDIGKSSASGMVSLILGLTAIAGPLVALFKVTFYAWRKLIGNFMPVKEDTVSEHPTETSKSTFDLELGFNVRTLMNPSQEEDPEKKFHRFVSLSDPFGIRQQTYWIGLLKSDINVFRGIRESPSKLKLISLAIFGFMSLLYIILDICSAVHSIGQVYSDKFESYMPYVGHMFESAKESMEEVHPVDTAEILASMREFAISLDSSPFYTITCAVLRILLELYLLPFVISGNVMTVIANWKHLAKEGFLRMSYALSIVIVFAYIILFGAWGGICSTEWDTFPSNYTVFPNTERDVITNSSRAGICNMKLGEWDLLELAAAPMLSTLKVQISDSELFRNITEEFMPSGGKDVKYMRLGFELIPSEYPEFLHNITNLSISMDFWAKELYEDEGMTQKSGSILYAFGGVSSNEELAFMTENVVKYWFDVAMNSMIPFFSIVRTRFIDSFLEKVAGIVDDVFIGFETYTETKLKNSIFWLSALYEFEKYMMQSMKATQVEMSSIAAGHSSGGLFGKAFAAAKDLQVIALQTPVFEHSRSHDLLLGSELFSGHRGIGWEKLINVYSSGSIFAADEANATANLKYPATQSLFRPPSAYETFCELVAGCVDDDRYDHFCTHVVGVDKYMSYFQGWQRERAPIDENYM